MSVEPAPERLLDRLVLERNGVPIYVQLREQILQAVRSGLLGPRERLPTMRQVAIALKVDLNTVRRAYDELERLGALTLERGRGSFVAEAEAPESAGAAERARAIALKALADARAVGLEPADLIAALASIIEEEGQSP